VLELGCGPGAGLSALASSTAAARIIGIDLSPDMIFLARKRNRRAVARGTMEIYQASFTALPLEAATVDRILAVNVAYFFPAGTAALEEACRVLKPGGIMAVFATDRASMQRFAFAPPDTHRLFDADELVACLRQGFETDSILIRRVSLALGITGLITTVRKSD
jgi:ubiquinone/menaquinone biosynthesis C-methylase UbiE